jgi:hypothetical protein
MTYYRRNPVGRPRLFGYSEATKNVDLPPVQVPLVMHDAVRRLAEATGTGVDELNRTLIEIGLRTVTRRLRKEQT